LDGQAREVIGEARSGKVRLIEMTLKQELLLEGVLRPGALGRQLACCIVLGMLMVLVEATLSLVSLG